MNERPVDEHPGAVPALPDPATFSSGESGHVAGVRRVVTRTLADRALDLLLFLRGTGRRLDALARRFPARRVLVLSIYRPGARRLPAALDELRRSRHELRIAVASTGPAHRPLAEETVATDLGGGKFQNLNVVLAQLGAGQRLAGDEQPAGDEQLAGDEHLAGGEHRRADWTIVIDDDVQLPDHFLDRFLGLCEAFDLSIAQPAQTLMSHAAWRVTRRRTGSLLRETRFVEIGPLTAFRRDAGAELMPFPDLRFGWGLDAHWSALAAERGWRLGIADAVPVRHEDAPVGADYGSFDPIAEAQSFLAGRPYVERSAALETVRAHARLPR